MGDSKPAMRIEAALSSPATTEHRAKRIGGAPFVSPSYRRAKALVADSLRARMLAAGVSQRGMASAAGVNLRLVQAWIDPAGPNGLRLDLALTVALDGDDDARAAMAAVLRDVLAAIERG